MLPEQQELNMSVDQKDVKQEKEEVWTSNERQQLHWLDTEKTKFRFARVPVKTENDDEIPQSSQVLQNSDMLQQLVIKEEMLPEQQELNLSVDQKDIKQEQEEDWSSNEGQQLHWLDTEKTKFGFAHVPVKTENDDEIPQSSQVLQNSDMLQQLVIKEEMLPEQQELSLSVDQKDIKQEQDEVWTNNERQQLHWLDTEKTKFRFARVPVKTENDDEIPQSSQVLQNSDMLQQLVIKDEMLPEQQELNLSVDQKDIKQEQDEVWTNNEGQQLHWLDTEKTKFCFACVPVKTENDDEIPQSSQVLQNSDMLQQLVIKEEMLPEQQELNLSVDQKDVKREQEEVWTSNEGQQLHWLETEKTKLRFAHVPVKTENDDEIPQSSQVLQNSDMQQLLLIKEEIIPEQEHPRPEASLTHQFSSPLDTLVAVLLMELLKDLFPEYCWQEQLKTFFPPSDRKS
ncbi:bromodomain-containing protein DDB_G0280777-like [Thalassophryne amazonica]|uniref:bromodomain-containing protein DDB_G0280777-like n=1 Tax=Thalassophryne amazonica TaxID=390379 RepID=UPI0014724973|nr:bromodomain-containing protein DDB_G0280777-like [Thalassophryne amazonica]